MSIPTEDDYVSLADDIRRMAKRVEAIPDDHNWGKDDYDTLCDLHDEARKLMQEIRTIIEIVEDTP